MISTAGKVVVVMSGSRIPAYLAGGVPRANCILAYEPIGAVSLAASYINKVSPGTYNAAPGTAPTFSAATGWAFNGSTQYLLTGYTPAAAVAKTILVRFSGATITAGSTHALCGEMGAVPRAKFDIYVITSPGDKYYFSNGTIDDAGNAAEAAGVLGISGLGGWFNGSKTKVLTNSVGTNSAEMVIGGINVAGSITPSYAGNIQAFYLYDIALSDTQMLAVSTAMAALTNP